MTVIAWDGETLAADKMAGDSWVNCSVVTKIERLPDGSLIGGSGAASTVRELRAWYTAGAVPADFPASNKNVENCSRLLRITPDGQIDVYESGPFPLRFENKFYAIGSGKEVALAVMMLGHDAIKAVEIASRISNGCGNGMDVLRLRQ